VTLKTTAAPLRPTAVSANGAPTTTVWSETATASPNDDARVPSRTSVYVHIPPTELKIYDLRVVGSPMTTLPSPATATAAPNRLAPIDGGVRRASSFQDVPVRPNTPSPRCGCRVRISRAEHSHEAVPVACLAGDRNGGMLRSGGNGWFTWPHPRLPTTPRQMRKLARKQTPDVNDVSGHLSTMSRDITRWQVAGAVCGIRICVGVSRRICSPSLGFAVLSS